jgi:hypothetical protein
MVDLKTWITKVLLYNNLYLFSYNFINLKKETCRYFLTSQ